MIPMSYLLARSSCDGTRRRTKRRLRAALPRVIGPDSIVLDLGAGRAPRADGRKSGGTAGILVEQEDIIAVAEEDRGPMACKSRAVHPRPY